MKNLPCDICGEACEAEDFEHWFKLMHQHWIAEHPEVMAKMAETGTKEDGEKWMAEHKEKFEAA